MNRAYYSSSLAGFQAASPELILGELAAKTTFAMEATQRDAWLAQITILKSTLATLARDGRIYFEFVVPRLGRRIDVVIVTGSIVFVVEFKVGEKLFPSHAIDQVFDYALDLKNFHESSHAITLAPILVATDARDVEAVIATTARNDGLLFPIRATPASLPNVMQNVLNFAPGDAIDVAAWEAGRYQPTPTIIEAATALYAGHGVADIARSDASAINLAGTSDAISQIIADAQTHKRKSIIFVTGVPGAGKTLVGLNIATQHIDPDSALHSVFLSGNGPLVAILREALARDKVARGKLAGTRVKKGEAMSEVKMFIQNVHHFRDECLVDAARPPIEHVALFDEAQRAWNREQTSSFMLRKKGRAGFAMSEPEFLISCLDRHEDWAAIVCLVGGGQEINTGEAGIAEWVDAIQRTFPHWHLHISSRLTDSEYGLADTLPKLAESPRVAFDDSLHLGVSMRSFRAEHVSRLVKELLDLDQAAARETLKQVADRYSIVLTRSLDTARAWLKSQARGSERYGIVVSSQAQRLKPHAIDVKSPMDPVHWFLDGKEDVRSSYYLEDVATEFHVQGLELDWSCVVWDADFTITPSGWQHRSFCGDRWNAIRKPERQTYLKNAYRVLLTRARQGMVLVVPEGNVADPTRPRAPYDATFDYLANVGFAKA